jgi:hypothetical protein
MKSRLWLIVFVAAVVFSGCQARTTAGEAKAPATAKGTTAQPAPAATAETLSWNRKAFAAGADDFRFAIVADNTGGMRPRVFKDAVGKLNLLKPEFVMCVGDLVEGYEEDEAAMKTQWDEFAGEVAALDAPFFGAVGNHDVSNEKMTAYIERRFGPVYYSFMYKDALFLVLNSQDDPTREDEYRSGLSEAQVAFVEKALAGNPKARWTFVFMHQPLFARDEYAAAPGWSRVEAMLSSRPHTVFAGHWHEYAKHVVNGHSYYRLGTTGGASELRGAERGQFDQIVWVTMTAAGPLVANLDLKGIYPDDVATDQTAIAYNTIARGSFMKAPSFVTDQRPFAGAKAAVELTNKTDFPLSVKATITSASTLVIAPSAIDTKVAPHSTSPVAVSIDAPTPADPDSIEPFLVDWTASYEVAGKKAIEGTGRSLIVIEGVHSCRKAAAPVKIDGDLSDWGELSQRFATPMESARNGHLWQGPADASIAFAASYDDKYIYLAFAVTDDKVVVDSEHNPRQEDALTVLVDARPEAVRNVPTKDWKQFSYFVMSPRTEPGKYELGEKLPEGAVVESVVTPTGFTTEIALPVELLDGAAGGKWQDFRLNVRLHDLDTNQYDNTQIWWRPTWDGALNYPGSGTFNRE